MYETVMYETVMYGIMNDKMGWAGEMAIERCGIKYRGYWNGNIYSLLEQEVTIIYKQQPKY